MNRSALLTISFLEGGVLMAYELLASKLYTPLIGSTIYVWTSVLITVLVGLALGYRKGDKVAEGNEKKQLSLSLLIAALFILCAPLISNFILPLLTGFNVRVAALIAGMLLLFIPMYCLGTVSPLITRMLSKNYEEAGQHAGTIYFISTIGGVLLGMLAIFYGIEWVGVTSLILSLGVILAMIGAYSKFGLKA